MMGIPPYMNRSYCALILHHHVTQYHQRYNRDLDTIGILQIRRLHKYGMTAYETAASQNSNDTLNTNYRTVSYNGKTTHT